jgi:DNA-binding FrmR family transcriptional regulator
LCTTVLDENIDDELGLLALLLAFRVKIHGVYKVVVEKSLLHKALAISLPGGYDTGMSHTSHPEIMKRLKRAQGHLKSTIEMLENGRDCLDIVQQLHAVEKAITNAKKALVHDHIDHCLEQTVKKGGASAADTVREFKDITKYL